jgi:membrane protease YdiL (CAAX protease family)
VRTALNHRILENHMRAFPDIHGPRGPTRTSYLTEVGPADSRHSRRWFIMAPLVLMAATYAVFQLLMPVAGERAAYFGGFAFYWLVGGIVLPILLIGRSGVASLFARPTRALSLGYATALVLLAVPVVFGFLFAFPSLFPMASGVTVAGLVAYALVNGTCEEVFWRGTFARRFPSDRWLGVLYPAVIFSFWHLVPWVVFPAFLHVNALAVLGVVFPIALVYHWVAWSTGSIRWTVLSHVLTNMAGLGAMLAFGPGW